MGATWVAILTALAYLCALFAIAHYGDTAGRRFVDKRGRATIYALGLGVYCTSWTFFGSVGLASAQGLDFIPIYLGPVLVIGLAYPFVERLVRLAKAQNTTSIADFVAARYGKSESVAAIVALIACLSVVPYMALQLKAMSASFAIVLASFDAGTLKPGVAWLAAQVRCPVVPARVEGIRAERHVTLAPFLRSRARIRTFPPIACAELGAPECLARLKAVIGSPS